MKRNGLLMLNIIVTSKPSDGLFFYSCEHYFKLKDLGIPVQLLVFTSGKPGTESGFAPEQYLKSVEKKYTQSIPIIFNDYFPGPDDVNLIMGRSMLTLGYKNRNEHGDDRLFTMHLVFKCKLISVYSENHPKEYDEAVEYFNPEAIIDLCDYDVYPNGVGNHFEKYIHFDYYIPPVDDVQFEHMFLGTTPEYYEWAKKVVYKYPDYGIIGYCPPLYVDWSLNNVRAPVENLLGKFNKYVYVKQTFDPAPRLLQECQHYGKEIIFDRPDIHDGGSVYKRRGLKTPDVSEIVKAYDKLQRMG